MDISVFRWINSWSDSWHDFYVFLSEATKQSSVRIVLGLFVIFMLCYAKKTRVAIIIALLSFVLANGFTEAMKWQFEMLRPCVELDGVQLHVKKLTSFGTASSHSANMMAIAAAFVMLLGWKWSGWVALAILVGISRIYVGVHYPSQVLLGWASGILCAWILVQCYGHLQKLKYSTQADTQPDE